MFEGTSVIVATHSAEEEELGGFRDIDTYRQQKPEEYLEYAIEVARTDYEAEARSFSTETGLDVTAAVLAGYGLVQSAFAVTGQNGLSLALLGAAFYSYSTVKAARDHKLERLVKLEALEYLLETESNMNADDLLSIFVMELTLPPEDGRIDSQKLISYKPKIHFKNVPEGLEEKLQSATDIVKKRHKKSLQDKAVEFFPNVRQDALASAELVTKKDHFSELKREFFSAVGAFSHLARNWRHVAKLRNSKSWEEYVKARHDTEAAFIALGTKIPEERATKLKEHDQINPMAYFANRYRNMRVAASTQERTLKDNLEHQLDACKGKAAANTFIAVNTALCAMALKDSGAAAMSLDIAPMIVSTFKAGLFGGLAFMNIGPAHSINKMLNSLSETFERYSAPMISMHHKMRTDMEDMAGALNMMQREGDEAYGLVQER